MRCRRFAKRLLGESPPIPPVCFLWRLLCINFAKHSCNDKAALKIARRLTKCIPKSFIAPLAQQQLHHCRIAPNCGCV